MADGRNPTPNASALVLREALQLVAAILFVLGIVALTLASVLHSGGWPAV